MTSSYHRVFVTRNQKSMSYFDTVPDGFIPTAEEGAELDARNQERHQQLLPEEAKETDSEGSEIDDTNRTTNMNCPGRDDGNGHYRRTTQRERERRNESNIGGAHGRQQRIDQLDAELTAHEAAAAAGAGNGTDTMHCGECGLGQVSSIHQCPERHTHMHGFCGTGVGEEGHGQARLCTGCKNKRENPPQQQRRTDPTSTTKEQPTTNQSTSTTKEQPTTKGTTATKGRQSLSSKASDCS